jgi:rod shape-determining protein MreD
MMKRITIVVSVLVCIYFDSIFFMRLNIVGIRPDMLLAVAVSFGVLLGRPSSLLIGGISGLVMDILFGEFIGMNLALYLLAALAGSIFHRKYYADNVIIPAATAFAAAIIKELLVGAVAALMGITYHFGSMLIQYILPCAAFTAVVCAGAHAIFRPIVARQAAKRRDHLHI